MRVSWFTFIEQSHPELQKEFVAKDEAAKAKRAAQSRAGASYNIALQNAEIEKLSPDFLPNRRMSPCSVPDT